MGPTANVSAATIRQAIQDEQRESELCRTCKLEISEKERQYHKGNKNIDIFTFCCNPVDQMCVSSSERFGMENVNC